MRQRETEQGHGRDDYARDDQVDRVKQRPTPNVEDESHVNVGNVWAASVLSHMAKRWHACKTSHTHKQTEK